MILAKLLLALSFSFISSFCNLEETTLKPTDPPEFIGAYSGMFSGSVIVIYLETVQDGKATGYNIHRNLKRPLSGTYELVSGASNYKFILLEPGDSEFDGSFEMLIDTIQFNGSGTWVPKPGSKLSPISFSFAKEK
jgi:hypothetical protein